MSWPCSVGINRSCPSPQDPEKMGRDPGLAQVTFLGTEPRGRLCMGRRCPYADKGFGGKRKRANGIESGREAR